jgi:hypothetical protein
MLSVWENYCPDQVTFLRAEPSHPTTVAVTGESAAAEQAQEAMMLSQAERAKLQSKVVRP